MTNVLRRKRSIGGKVSEYVSPVVIVSMLSAMNEWRYSRTKYSIQLTTHGISPNLPPLDLWHLAALWVLLCVKVSEVINIARKEINITHPLRSRLRWTNDSTNVITKFGMLNGVCPIYPGYHLWVLPCLCRWQKCSLRVITMTHNDRYLTSLDTF